MATKKENFDFKLGRSDLVLTNEEYGNRERPFRPWNSSKQVNFEETIGIIPENVEERSGKLN